MDPWVGESPDSSGGPEDAYPVPSWFLILLEVNSVSWHCLSSGSQVGTSQIRDSWLPEQSPGLLSSWWQRGVSEISLQLLVCVRLEGGGASPLGKEKQTVGLIVREQWLQEAVRGEVPWDSHEYHQRFDPAWFYLLGSAGHKLRKGTHHPTSSLQAKSESWSPVGAQREGNKTGDCHLQSYRSNKSRQRRTDRKEYSGNYVRLGTLVLLIGNRWYWSSIYDMQTPETHLNLGQSKFSHWFQSLDFNPSLSDPNLRFVMTMLCSL